MLLYKVSLIPTGYESYLYIVIFVPLAVVLAICLLIKIGSASCRERV